MTPLPTLYMINILPRRLEKRKHFLNATENTILLAVQIPEDTSYVLSPYIRILHKMFKHPFYKCGPIVLVCVAVTELTLSHQYHSGCLGYKCRIYLSLASTKSLQSTLQAWAKFVRRTTPGYYATEQHIDVPVQRA